MGLFGENRATERLEDHLCQLQRQVDDLHNANKRLNLEWEELYDKVRRQMARMSKRVAVDAKNNGELIPVDSENSPSDTLDPISRSIMLRRGHSGVGK